MGVGDAVVLEAGQVNVVRAEFIAVAFPKHSEVDQVG